MILPENQAKDGETFVYSLDEFTGICKIEHFNLHKIIAFMVQSSFNEKVNASPSNSIYLKIASYCEILSQTETQDPFGAQKTSIVHCFYSLQQFLLMITSSDKHGKIFVQSTRQQQSKADVKIKYLSLYPGSAMKCILKEARTVMLIGGTLTPVNF